MSSQETKFEQVLDALAEKEHRARKQATLLTVLTLAVGLVLMAALFYQIVSLRNTRSALEDDVRKLYHEKGIAAGELEQTKFDVENKKKELAAAEEQRKEVVKNIKAKNYEKALQIASTEIRKDSGSQSTVAPGFVDDRNFKGPAQTRIAIEVIPDKSLLESSTRPNTLFTYRVTGETTHDATDKISFGFSLDGSKTVGLIFDFAREGPGGFTIKQTASAGRTRYKQFRVNPVGNRVGHGVTLNFEVK